MSYQVITTPVATPEKDWKKVLAKEPCDRATMLEYAKQVMRNGTNREAIEKTNEFFDRCGDDDDLRELMYTAHSYLNEWEAAAAEMTHLLKAQPNNESYYGWRGIAFAKNGDLLLAAADFRQALAIKPKLARIPFNLADVYERLGEPCEAIPPLAQYVYFYPGEESEAAAHRVERLYQDKRCKGLVGSGRAVIRFAPTTDTIPVAVQINGHSGQFVVDTGASLVTLSAEFATAIGLDYRSWPTSYALTAGGIRPMQVGKVAVQLQGVKASQVDAAVVEDIGGIQGLLGVSFLSRFKVNLDHASGRLELASR